MQPDTSEPKLRGKVGILFQALSSKLDKFVSIQSLQQAIGERDVHRVSEGIANLREAVAPYGYHIETRRFFGYLMTKTAA